MALQPKVQRTLVGVITEIAYRSVSTVGAAHGLTDPRGIATIAEALAEKIADQVTMQHDPRMVWTFQAVDQETFELFSAILDDMQKSIPVIARMDVVVTLHRLGKGVRNAATAINSGDGGDAQGLDA